MAGRDTVAWYWRLVALGSFIIILGGFLILPVTFDNDPGLRPSATAVGIFAVALLTAGFVLTGLLCFAVRIAIFQVESIFLPSMLACIIGLLTVFYDFLISRRYHWNTPALLVTIAAAIGSIVYGFFVVYTYRKIQMAKAARSNGALPLNGDVRDNESGLWQDPLFYENYVRNMFPTSTRQVSTSGSYDPNAIPEEDMLKQQLLMLLQQPEQHMPHGRAADYFHIEWQGREEDEISPVHGYYAPNQSQISNTSYPGPSPGISRRLTDNLRPWDGIWRTPVASTIPAAVLPESSRVNREERRREIEMGK